MSHVRCIGSSELGQGLPTIKARILSNLLCMRPARLSTFGGRILEFDCFEQNWPEEFRDQNSVRSILKILFVIVLNTPIDHISHQLSGNIDSTKRSSLYSSLVSVIWLSAPSGQDHFCDQVWPRAAKQNSTANHSLATKVDYKGSNVVTITKPLQICGKTLSVTLYQCSWE